MFMSEIRRCQRLRANRLVRSIASSALSPVPGVQPIRGSFYSKSNKISLP